jgi:hypothetical protein
VTCLTLLSACGAKTRNAQPLPTLASQPSPSASVASSPPAAPPLPDFDALAAKQPVLAAGLHELARGDVTSSVALPKAEHDTCVRIVVVGAQPLRASLVTKDGAVLASMSKPAREAVLGDRGPVCFHASSEPRLTVDGDAGAARYIVWGA